MISNLALIDNPLVRELATQMMTLPHVVDVRFFPTLKTELVELGGEDLLTIQAITLVGTEYRHPAIIVPKDIYSDKSKHSMVVQTMANKIAQAWNEAPIKVSEITIAEVIIPEPVPAEPLPAEPAPQPADQQPPTI